MKTSLKTINLRFFKLIAYNFIWTLSVCQMYAISPGVEFLRTLFRFKERKSMFTSSVKRRIRRCHVIVVQLTSRKCTKKRDARAELLFCS